MSAGFRLWSAPDRMLGKSFAAAHGQGKPICAPLTSAHYNLGLAYLEAKGFDKAVDSAYRAYELGFPPPGLKDRLERAGKWRDPVAPAPAESPDVRPDAPAPDPDR